MDFFSTSSLHTVLLQCTENRWLSHFSALPYSFSLCVSFYKYPRKILKVQFAELMNQNRLGSLLIILVAETVPWFMNLTGK